MKNNKRQLGLMSVLSELFPGKQIQTSLLRTYVKLANGKQSYVIPFKKDSASNAEALISDSDIVIASSVQFALAKVKDAKVSQAQLFTYPDEVHFTYAGSKADDLRSIYNTGYLQYVQGSTIVQDSVPLLEAYTAQLTQVANAKPCVDYSVDGIVELFPPLAIVGNSLPEAKLNFSTEENPAIEGATTDFNYVVLIHRGVLLKGVSKSEYERTMQSAIAKAKFARMRASNYLG